MKVRKTLSLFLVFCLMAALLPPPGAQAAEGLEVAVTVPHTQTDTALTNYFTLASGRWEAGTRPTPGPAL